MRQLSNEQRFEKLEADITAIKYMLEELLKGTPSVSPEESKKEIMSVKQLAEFLGMDVNLIYARCAKGDLPYFKLGKQYRFKKVDILKWIKEQKEDSAFSLDNYVDRYLQKHELKG